ncbi:MAG TPA: GNAT family N-acetyltransferase [Gemmatimonadaceae bacterium]|nr:GNAT family N-acetyltransferase [Gemmatimonadaceae bacterium]
MSREHDAGRSGGARHFRAITVREATEADLGVVLELRLALLAEHRDNLIYRRVRPDLRERARELYLAQLRSPREITLLAERNGEVVGILRCVESSGYPILLPSQYGYVSSAYVRSTARREGVLRTLMESAIAWCRERGLSEMRLHSTVENLRANSAWDALGFEVVEHLRVRLLR